VENLSFDEETAGLLVIEPYTLSPCGLASRFGEVRGRTACGGRQVQDQLRIEPDRVAGLRRRRSWMVCQEMAFLGRNSCRPADLPALS
jgi:hypothetical protein